MIIPGIIFQSFNYYIQFLVFLYFLAENWIQFWLSSNGEQESNIYTLRTWNRANNKSLKHRLKRVKPVNQTIFVAVVLVFRFVAKSY